MECVHRIQRPRGSLIGGWWNEGKSSRQLIGLGVKDAARLRAEARLASRAACLHVWFIESRARQLTPRRVGKEKGQVKGQGWNATGMGGGMDADDLWAQWGTHGCQVSRGYCSTVGGPRNGGNPVAPAARRTGRVT